MHLCAIGLGLSRKKIPEINSCRILYTMIQFSHLENHWTILWPPLIVKNNLTTSIQVIPFSPTNLVNLQFHVM